MAALTPCRVAILPHARLRAIVDESPSLRDALLALTFVENAMATQWAVCLGGMTAEERCAHLLCELAERLASIEGREGGELPFPITQQMMAEVLGVSAVHVNRTLFELRSASLATIEGRRLIVHDAERLAELGHFDPGYLYLGRPPILTAAGQTPIAT